MKKTSLFSLPNYPAWFGADTFLMAGSAVHWIVISVMAYQLSGSVAVAGWFAAGSPLGAVLFGISQAFPFFASALFDVFAFLSALCLRLPPIAPEKTDDAQDDGRLASFWRDMVDIGIIVGSVFSKRVCNRIPVGKGLVCIMAFSAVAYVPMVFSDAYPVILVSTCLARFPMPLFSALANGFVFSKTPVKEQGRTRSAIMTVIMLVASFSGAVAGELIPRVGFSGFMVVMVALSLVGSALVTIDSRLRNLPASDQWPSVEL